MVSQSSSAPGPSRYFFFEAGALLSSRAVPASASRLRFAAFFCRLVSPGVRGGDPSSASSLGLASRAYNLYYQ